MKITYSAVALLLSIAVLAGCGSDHPPIGQSPQSEVNSAVQMRAIFDKVNGDANALSADDKAQLLKLGGTQASVDATWKIMSQNKRGAPASNTPPH